MYRKVHKHRHTKNTNICNTGAYTVTQECVERYPFTQMGTVTHTDMHLRRYTCRHIHRHTPHRQAERNTRNHPGTQSYMQTHTYTQKNPETHGHTQSVTRLFRRA